MNPTVEELLHRIQSTEFFRNSKNDTQFENALRIKTPAAAQKRMQNRKWENDKLEMRNLISRKILSAGERGKLRDQTWNDFTAMIRSKLGPILEKQIQPAAAACGLSVEPSFLAQIQWDLMSAFQEAEFVEFGTIGFYHTLWDWYEAGYLPCGYDGQLVIQVSETVYQFSETILSDQNRGKFLVY